jgi:hypothetical protein
MSNHVTSDLSWDGHIVYNEVFRHIEARYQLVIPLFLVQPVTSADAYAINHPRGSDFTDEDIDLAILLS